MRLNVDEAFYRVLIRNRIGKKMQAAYKILISSWLKQILRTSTNVKQPLKDVLSKEHIEFFTINIISTMINRSKLNYLVHAHDQLHFLKGSVQRGVASMLHNQPIAAVSHVHVEVSLQHLQSNSSQSTWLTRQQHLRATCDATRKHFGHKRLRRRRQKS